jgi:aminoglycoside phosphotransferase (APT) family kinase protein/SAM-dependent methyltransferase
VAIKLVTNIPKIDLKIIRDYIRHAEGKGSSSFIPHGATNVKFYKLSKRSMTVNNVYSFSVAYVDEGINRTSDFVLKLYPDDKERCQKEHDILKCLECANFPVPHVFIKEIDGKFFGAPFLIMEKIEGKTLKDYIGHVDEEEILNIIKNFAETLVHLHKLKWKEIDLDFLRTPKNNYHYAEKQALWKDELPDYMNKKGFEWATSWLKINAQKNPCDHYSLVRNDMNLKNFLVAQKGKIIMLDWEWAEIGDPLKDVGYAYHNIRHAFGIRNINRKGKKIAAYFIRKYIENSSRKIDLSALRFYLFSAGLREAIYLRHIKGEMKHPSFAKNFGLVCLPFIPLIWWHYRSRYKHLESYLRREAMDYEEAMFGTLGGKILSRMEIGNVLGFLEAKPFELILDVGASSGRISREIVSNTKANVIAIDAERMAVQSAKKREGSLTKYEMAVADGQYLPFKNSCFDGMVCIRALKYFPDYVLGISEMARVLKSNGRLVVDLSSMLGYEAFFRYITHVTSARGARVFNFYKMKNLLKNQKLTVVKSTPLQKIPHKIWNLSANTKILQLLAISERLLDKIPPQMLSRSILLKCVKD